MTSIAMDNAETIRAKEIHSLFVIGKSVQKDQEGTICNNRGFHVARCVLAKNGLETKISK